MELTINVPYHSGMIGICPILKQRVHKFSLALLTGHIQWTDTILCSREGMVAQCVCPLWIEYMPTHELKTLL